MQVEQLIKSMQSEYNKWAFSTRVYGTSYVIVRLFLIIATSIVAAEKTLDGSAVGFLVKLVPALAVAVSILTALDTWMKPRDKWRGFMEDRDDLNDLIIRANTEIAHAETSTEGAPADKLREEFKQLRARHREKNVF